MDNPQEMKVIISYWRGACFAKHNNFGLNPGFIIIVRSSETTRYTPWGRVKI